MTISLQIAAVAAVLIVGGLSALALAARNFDRRFPEAGQPSDRE
jgi:hypothetical protein